MQHFYRSINNSNVLYCVCLCVSYIVSLVASGKWYESSLMKRKLLGYITHLHIRLSNCITAAAYKIKMNSFIQLQTFFFEFHKCLRSRIGFWCSIFMLTFNVIWIRSTEMKTQHLNIFPWKLNSLRLLRFEIVSVEHNGETKRLFS